MTNGTGRGGCPCGAASFRTDGAPLFRTLCHCTICQAYNGAPYGDVAVFRARDVRLDDEAAIDWRAWKRPPIVRRGTCRACGAPAVERIRAPVLPALTVIPIANLGEGVPVPPASMHIHYGTRVADVDDDLRKHDREAASQLAWFVELVRSMRRARAAG